MRRAPRLGSSLAVTFLLCGATTAPAQTGSVVPLTGHAGGHLSRLTVTGEIDGGRRDGEAGSGGRAAPEPPRRSGSLLGDIGRDYVSFFTTRGTYLTLGAGLGTSLGLRPLDQPISTSRFNAELYENSGVDRMFEGGEVLGGGFLQIGGAFLTYGAGKLTGRSEISELGRDLVRTQLLTQGVTQAIKYGVGRARPDGSSHAFIPLGARVRHVRHGDRLSPAVRMEGGVTGLWHRVLGGRVAVEREQAFPERRRLWRGDRTCSWPHRHLGPRHDPLLARADGGTGRRRRAGDRLQAMSPAGAYS